jgi:hypothetical protein
MARTGLDVAHAPEDPPDDWEDCPVHDRPELGELERLHVLNSWEQERRILIALFGEEWLNRND